MHGSNGLEPGVQNGLAIFYFLVVLLNVGFSAYQFYGLRDRRQAFVWLAVGGLFLLHALIYAVHIGPPLSQGFRNFTTWVMGLYGGQMGPILYFVLSVAAFAACTPHRWPPSPDSPGPHYYVAMGDSLSTGTQPPYTEENNFGDTDEGYTNQLFAKLRQQDTKLEMVELGCGGETAVSRNSLAGMQPRCKQVPPTLYFSTTAIFRPALAPYNAAA